MKLSKDQVHDEIILHLKEHEYVMILAALKAATADDTRKGIEYFHFYGAEKGEIVRLHNEIDEEERRV